MFDLDIGIKLNSKEQSCRLNILSFPPFVFCWFFPKVSNIVFETNKTLIIMCFFTVLVVSFEAYEPWYSYASVFFIILFEFPSPSVHVF